LRLSLPRTFVHRQQARLKGGHAGLKTLVAMILIGAATAVFVAVSMSEAFSDVSSAPEDLNLLLEPIRKTFDLPALAAAIVTSNGLVAVGAVGVRKYGTDSPVTVNDQFHLGSDTKAVTRDHDRDTGGTRQAELEHDSGTSFPQSRREDESGVQESHARAVALPSLRIHRRQLAAGQDFSGHAQAPRHAARAARGLRGDGPCRASRKRTRSAYLYSNRNYAVAGAIAERFANDSWENLLRKRIFDPLGMQTCGFGAMGTPGVSDPRQIDQPWSTNCS